MESTCIIIIVIVIIIIKNLTQSSSILLSHFSVPIDEEGHQVTSRVCIYAIHQAVWVWVDCLIAGIWESTSQESFPFCKPTTLPWFQNLLLPDTQFAFLSNSVTWRRQKAEPMLEWRLQEQLKHGTHSLEARPLLEEEREVPFHLTSLSLVTELSLCFGLAESLSIPSSLSQHVM